PPPPAPRSRMVGAASDATRRTSRSSPRSTPSARFVRFSACSACRNSPGSTVGSSINSGSSSRTTAAPSFVAGSIVRPPVDRRLRVEQRFEIERSPLVESQKIVERRFGRSDLAALGILPSFLIEKEQHLLAFRVLAKRRQLPLRQLDLRP